MPNILDYIEWRGDLSFERDQLNEVDALILAELSYIDYTGIVGAEFSCGPTLKEASARYFELNPLCKGKLGLIVPDAIHDLLKAAAASERFGKVQLSGYANDTSEADEKQFAAVTFTLGRDTRFIAFRGTDDTIVGWKENFNMCYMFPVPAQEQAARYVNEAAAQLGGRLIIGGHSKGGNLAVYAAAYCDEAVQQRISAVYNNDGPGFPNSQISRQNYGRIRGCMTTLLPEASIVGILLVHESCYRAVKSTASGIRQHDGFSWQVTGTRFTYAEDIKTSSKRKDKTLRAWVDDMDMEQRTQFVNKLFAIRANTDAATITELAKNPQKLWPALSASFDEETVAVLKRSFSMLWHEDRAFRADAAQEGLQKLKSDIGIYATSAVSAIGTVIERDKQKKS